MDAVTPKSPRQLEHGGNLDAARASFPEPAEGWVDLSTGINPIPYPVPNLDNAAWNRLPDTHLTGGLISAARTYYGTGENAAIIAASGTQALIQLLPSLLSLSRVAVVSPTYGEHAHVWRAFGHSVMEIPSLEESFDDVHVVVVVNPNNPDGRVFDRDTLIALAGMLSARGGFLIVDEAFADMTPEISLAHCAGVPGLLILKSFGKFFGLAGLRLGFAIGHHETITKLSMRTGPWSVSGPALAIGAKAFMDQAWITKTRKRLQQDRERLERVLMATGVEVVGGTDLFVLANVGDALPLYDALAHTGILVRQFEKHSSWIRFGFPGREADWDRLKTALKKGNWKEQ